VEDRVGAMQMPLRKRKHRTVEEREEIVQSYRESGLTQKEFVERAGISVSALQSWLRRAEPTGKPGSPAFIAVPNLMSAPAPYRLQWPGGVSLEIRSGFRAQEVAALVQLLERP